MKKQGFLTIPNALTLSRILFAPLFIYSLSQGNPLTAFAVMIIAWTTDADGWVARKLHQETEFGRYFDYTADTIFSSATVLGTVYYHYVPLWYAIFISALFFLKGIGIWLQTYKKYRGTLLAKGSMHAISIYLAFALLQHPLAQPLLWMSLVYYGIMSLNTFAQGISSRR